MRIEQVASVKLQYIAMFASSSHPCDRTYPKRDGPEHLGRAMIILAEEGQEQRIRNAIAMNGGSNDRYG